MNVQGISTAPAPVPVPAIPRVAEPTRSETHPQHSGGDRRPDSHDQAVPAALKAPPVNIRPLSTSEVRVFLGMAPPDLLFQRAAPVKGRPTFDTYA